MIGNSKLNLHTGKGRVATGGNVSGDVENLQLKNGPEVKVKATGKDFNPVDSDVAMKQMEKDSKINSQLALAKDKPGETNDDTIVTGQNGVNQSTGA